MIKLNNLRNIIFSNIQFSHNKFINKLGIINNLKYSLLLMVKLVLQGVQEKVVFQQVAQVQVVLQQVVLEQVVLKLVAQEQVVLQLVAQDQVVLQQVAQGQVLQQVVQAQVWDEDEDVQEDGKDEDVQKDDEDVQEEDVQEDEEDDVLHQLLHLVEIQHQLKIVQAIALEVSNTFYRPHMATNYF